MNLSTRLETLRERQRANVLVGIKRGVEREALRITSNGQLAQTSHPEALGATLTHPSITTDYAESLLEFITPVARSIRETLTQLRDLHRFTYRNIGEELLWPLSMPCYVSDPGDIRIADFGSSHVGRMKSTYRQGLTHRYGAVMQTIAGVHYNFSAPDSLWDELAEQDGVENTADFRSERYFALIRNFLKKAWVVPYFFGASPVICNSFLRCTPGELTLQEFGGGMLYRPYATSLRMSDLGYTNKEQASLEISYNSTQEYIDGLRRAVSTPSQQFARIGVKDENGEYRQLNSNILQIENEFYSAIRPKRTAHAGETPTQALERGGVEYIEIRALDVNPFTPVGVTAAQMLFLDLLLMHCLLSDSPAMSLTEQKLAGANLNKIVLDGREPRLRLQDGEHLVLVQDLIKDLFKELEAIAELMDDAYGGDAYRDVLASLAVQIQNPEQTLSGQLINAMRQAQQRGQGFAVNLGQQYRDQLIGEPLEFYNEDEMTELARRSLQEKADMEEAQVETFDGFLAAYFEAALVKKNAP